MVRPTLRRWEALPKRLLTRISAGAHESPAADPSGMRIFGHDRFGPGYHGRRLPWSPSGKLLPSTRAASIGPINCECLRRACGA